jgi:hypothetical protein
MSRRESSNRYFQSVRSNKQHAAFYEVYVDHGEGPTYFGKILVEEVDDTLIDEFSSNDGNLYKPDGTGAVLLLVLLVRIL